VGLRGISWRGMALHGMAWCGMAWHGVAHAMALGVCRLISEAPAQVDFDDKQEDSGNTVLMHEVSRKIHRTYWN
jgi:hypothetical protein